MTNHDEAAGVVLDGLDALRVECADLRLAFAREADLADLRTGENAYLIAALEGIRDFTWEDGKDLRRVVDALKRRAREALEDVA